MKKASLLIIVYNLFWGFVQTYKDVEYILSGSDALDDLAYKSFLGFSLISMALVLPLNIATAFTKEAQGIWGYPPYVTSIVFVVLTYLVGFAFLIFL